MGGALHHWSWLAHASPPQFRPVGAGDRVGGGGRGPERGEGEAGARRRPPSPGDGFSVRARAWRQEGDDRHPCRYWAGPTRRRRLRVLGPAAAHGLAGRHQCGWLGCARPRRRRQVGVPARLWAAGGRAGHHRGPPAPGPAGPSRALTSPTGRGQGGRPPATPAPLPKGPTQPIGPPAPSSPLSIGCPARPAAGPRPPPTPSSTNLLAARLGALGLVDRVTGVLRHGGTATGDEFFPKVFWVWAGGERGSESGARAKKKRARSPFPPSPLFRLGVRPHARTPAHPAGDAPTRTPSLAIPSCAQPFLPALAGAQPLPFPPSPFNGRLFAGRRRGAARLCPPRLGRARHL